MTLALVVAFPLAAAILIALAGGRLGRRTTGVVASLAIFLSFGAAASMIATMLSRPLIEARIGPWLPIAGADFALVVDSSMLAVTLTITGVSALISVYSIGYLAHDRGTQRYFAALDLFVAAMLLIVLASNLALLFAGWELVGLCSYLLIGHVRERPAAGAAAVRAFVVSRVGDAAFLGGILLIATSFHTLDLAQIAGVAIEHGNMGTDPLVVASALLLVGALAKSAQFPLHVWLPDAMEGPTPVSALIQAATMVTGGVVLLMRMRSALAPDVLQAAAIIGGFTALGAALVAMGQRDLRRVLAWSTISQVGLMFVAAGLGAVFAARFHLISHALFKATLLLGSGSVVHAASDELDIGRLGGLGRRMRWTAGAFAVGTLALAALPPVSGFFSNEGIAAAALAESEPFLLGLALVTSFISAFYAARLFVLVFVARPTVEREVHESSVVMVIPIAILAAGALVFGGLVSSGVLPIGSGRADEAPISIVAISFAIALAGFSLGWLTYRHGLERARPVEEVTGRLANGFGVDWVYRVTFEQPFTAIARELDTGAERANQLAIDGLVLLVRASSTLVRRVQAGYVSRYEILLIGGAVALLAYWNWSAR